MSAFPRDLVLCGDGIFGLSLECDQGLGKTAAGLWGPCKTPEVCSGAEILATALESEAGALARVDHHIPAYYV